MNKQDIIDLVYNDMVKSDDDGQSTTKTFVGRFINSFVHVIQEELSSGRAEKIVLTGFGTFASQTRKARKGRNPKTGEEIDIPASKVVKFTPGKYLKEMMAKS